MIVMALVLRLHKCINCLSHMEGKRCLICSGLFPGFSAGGYLPGFIFKGLEILLILLVAVIQEVLTALLGTSWEFNNLYLSHKNLQHH